jgi:hypothetical protein
MEGCCEHGNKISVSVNCCEILECLRLVVSQEELRSMEIVKHTRISHKILTETHSVSIYPTFLILLYSSTTDRYNRVNFQSQYGNVGKPNKVPKYTASLKP